MPFAQWGYPHKPGSAGAIPRAVSRRFHQRGHRPDPRLVLQPVGDQHAVVWRRSGETSPRPRARRVPLPRPRHRQRAEQPDAVLSLSASLPQLHRAGADAGRRRPEDVEEQAELPRAAARSSTATGPTPCGGTSSPISRRGPRSATASRRSRRRIPEFLLRLWNVYSFFVIYANIDGFDPAAADQPGAGRPA